MTDNSKVIRSGGGSTQARGHEECYICHCPVCDGVDEQPDSDSEHDRKLEEGE